jgi:thiaminase
MVPCCRLYGWLGVKLAQEKREEELEREEGERDARSKESTKVQKPNPFSAWIETYSSLEYHAATCKLEALLDRLAEGLSAEERGEFFFFF